MSDEEDDLFNDSDSDDTNELISNTQQKKGGASSAKKAAPRKGPPPKTAAAPKKKEAAAKKKDDSDSDGGLFDSDSEDDMDTDAKKPAAAPSPGLSRREKLEALAKRKHKDTAPVESSSKTENSDRKKDSGYESEDSYNSAEFQRTKEDDDFLDTTGEDAEAVNELYAEQHFDDVPADGFEEKKKKKRKIHYDDDNRPRGGEDLRQESKEPDNPIMAAVHRMKKKKKEKMTDTEREDECKLFLARMELAAEEDERAVSERRPATKKLSMLQETVDMLTKVDMQRMLLDLGLLTVCRRWVQPLPNGQLGNVTVRQRLLDVLANMTGESGISASDLKRSEFGKTVMVLFKHRSETPKMKQQLKKLIEQWSRPIFQKSGNMRDLERSYRGQGSLAMIGSQQKQLQQPVAKVKREQDIDSLIASGKQGKGETGVNRVRIPYSKGFNFSVRPQGRDAMASPERPKESRSNLKKRMIEKGRKVGKNQRSANISVEGRPTK